MPHDLQPAVTSGGIQEAAARDAARRDEDGRFPGAALHALAALGVVGDPPIGQQDIGQLLATLATIGRGDLSVGRIYEGHANALLLIRQYGTAEQNQRFHARARAGDLFGVWNTDLPADPVRLQGRRLVGKKNFATGADGLDWALVTAERSDGPQQMIAVPLAGCTVDRSWWRPLGMRASGSHVVDFTGLEIEPDWMVGRPGDYQRQPLFSAGAIRFAAVHVGGTHAVFDALLAHLQRTGRADDPYQRHRIGTTAIALQSGYGWLAEAAAAWRQIDSDGARAVAVANATRLGVEALALTVLQDAEQGVGAAGLIAPHPLERRMRDLRTYLRQPNPDGALAALGAAVAEGIWSPGPAATPPCGRS